jgi:uncharacterized protein YbaP (TraB family)
MKKILILSIIYLLCVNLNAQLLYEISGNGLTKSSYLFGTHHMVPVQTATKIPGLFRAFNDCSAVVGEFVDDNPEEMQRQILIASKMEESIFKLLTPEEEALIDSALQAELGLTLANVQYMRPNVIAMIYEMTVRERVLKSQMGDMAMDSYFQVAGSELGKAVYGLETVDDQLKMLLRSIPIERQAEILVETIRNTNDIITENSKLDSLYEKGDLEGLYEMLIETEDMTEAEKFLLVDERNHDWLPKIEKHIKQEPCFIAVGALHLPGNDGLINLLRKAGYKVKAVK